jgi:NTP pyrophosphatase (non-canonical NTP hydrolase)
MFLINIYKLSIVFVFMSFKDAPRDVDEWVKQFKTPYWPPLSILARITEEVGELSKELNDR